VSHALRGYQNHDERYGTTPRADLRYAHPENVSVQPKQMAEFFATVTPRMAKADIDLATIRDVCERLHLAASDPQGVTYAEANVDGVSALWCT
jgi:hypothetical protein